MRVRVRNVSGRPSASMVVAMTALFVALGGVAIASGGFVSSTGVIQGCVSKKGKLVLIKPGKSCKTGKLISWNEKGQKGDTGPAGTALAYAHVHADGTSDNTKSATTTAGAQSGEYCIKVPFTPHNVQVTLDANGGNFADVPLVSVPADLSGECAGTTANIQVDIAHNPGPTAHSTPFWIEIN